MTSDHLRVLLESDHDTALFCRAAQDLARAHVPPDVLALLRMGRLTALQKPGGGVRHIVCGDIVRRLVARTIAQMLAPDVEEATSPFQYAQTTKYGGECVAHAIQSLTDLDSRATVMSIDGISAFDLFQSRDVAVKRSGRGVRVAVRAPVLPALNTSGQTITVSLIDIHQGEGGEQGDALLPMLYSLGQHGALESIQESLRDDEHLFAHLDDLYVVCSPERVAPIFKIITQALQHARIQVNLGKMQRRIEVIAEGLPAFHGAQLAVDTTLVFPLRADGVPHRRCADESGAALEAARRRKDRTYPELSGRVVAPSLVVLPGEIGGRFSEEALSFLRTLARAKVRPIPTPLRSRARLSWMHSGGPCWLATRRARSLRRCSIGEAILGRMATLQQFLTCSTTSAGLLLRWPQSDRLPC